MGNFYKGRAREVAVKIVESFKSGELPDAIVPMFFDEGVGRAPCRRWSFANQLMVYLNGYRDARGFKQWKQVGRSVKKGERGFPILIPLIGNRRETDDETGEEHDVKKLYGFGHTVVFGYEQTEGDPLEQQDADLARWRDKLPFMGVAKAWGIDVSFHDGRAARAIGSFDPEKNDISLGVKDAQTWLHELVHAADKKVRDSGPDKLSHSETVAELGAAVLLRMSGNDEALDLGGCWKYIDRYAKRTGQGTVGLCMKLLDRVCNAVQQVMDFEKDSTLSQGNIFPVKKKMPQVK